jgi:phosphoribosylformimino-5-aminoimidazole carboxamide ribotide isomerase
MKIIPAIDIMDQKVVRLERGQFDKEKVYSENPVMAAKEWKARGAELLHVVDLDGTRLGKPVALDIVREIADNVGIAIELGGGLRTEEDIESAFKAGARFAVIGTSAVEDEGFCKTVTDKFKDRVIFAVDVKDGKVAIKGWKELSAKSALEYIKNLASLGAEKIIYTDISRDGMMQGPNLEALKFILQSTTLEVTASGGISSVDDIKTLKALEPDGLKAVIVGKALYEGKIDFREALRAG